MCSELLCPLCDISTFSDIESFKLNLIKVNSKPIKCPLCSEILLGLDKLTIHLFGHSLPFEKNSIKLLPQDETPQITQKKSSQEQLQNIIVDPMKMTSSSTSSSSLSLLMQTSETKDENFRCEICGFLFVEEQLLNLHLSLVHNFTPSSNHNENGEIIQKDKNEVKKWICHLCGKNFKMKGALRIHIRVFHDQNQRQINIAEYLRNKKSSIDMCTKQAEMLSLKDPYSPQNSPQYNAIISNTSTPRSPIQQDLQKVNSSEVNTKSDQTKCQKVFQCEECKKTFTTKYFLKKHKRLHTGEYPYRCEVEGCGKMFHFQQSYHKHLLYHSDAKPYECSECGRSFKELSTLNNHQRIHSGVKPFGCHVCGKFFRQKVSYLVHQRIHNGALPYKCSECGKSFRYKVSQRSHKCNGTIERQPGTLIQKLMQNSSILPTSTIVSNANVSNETIVPIATTTTHPTTENISIPNQTPPHETTIKTANNNIVATEHELCLDELLEESYEKLMKMNKNENQLMPQLTGNGSFMTHTIPSNNGNNGMMFENDMAITSNYGHHHHHSQTNFNSSFHSTLETINEDSIKDLLYGHVG